MGFLDDLVSAAKEYNSIKKEVTSNINDLKDEVTSIKTDAVSRVTEIKQQVKLDNKKTAEDDNSSTTD